MTAVAPLSRLLAHRVAMCAVAGDRTRDHLDELIEDMALVRGWSAATRAAFVGLAHEELAAIADDLQDGSDWPIALVEREARERHDAASGDDPWWCRACGGPRSPSPHYRGALCRYATANLI